MVFKFKPKLYSKLMLKGSKTIKIIKVFSNEVQKEPAEVFYKKAVLKNSAIFTGKHLCWSTCNFIKNELHRRCSPVNIADILRTTFLQNTSGRLLLEVESENIS